MSSIRTFVRGRREDQVVCRHCTGRWFAKSGLMGLDIATETNVVQIITGTNESSKSSS